MAGDGVNDAPAMATADASFAMFEGTDVAQHSASARLMGESLMHIDAAQKKSLKQRCAILNKICFLPLFITVLAFRLLHLDF